VEVVVVVQATPLLAMVEMAAAVLVQQEFNTQVALEQLDL
jgi:hypothetical protein